MPGTSVTQVLGIICTSNVRGITYYTWYYVRSRIWYMPIVVQTLLLNTIIITISKYYFSVHSAKSTVRKVRSYPSQEIKQTALSEVEHITKKKQANLLRVQTTLQHLVYIFNITIVAYNSTAVLYCTQARTGKRDTDSTYLKRRGSLFFLLSSRREKY